MGKVNANISDMQEKNLFPCANIFIGKKIQVDFNAPDISSNGGLLLAGMVKESLARKIARLIPDLRNQSSASNIRPIHENTVSV